MRRAGKQGVMCAILAVALLYATTARAVTLSLPAPALPANDVGSGADAGNTPASAYTLPGPGTYWGNLTPGDSDWYTLANAEPSCVAVSAAGAAIANVTLQGGSGGTRWSSQPMHSTLTPWQGVHLTLATLVSPYLGFVPDTLTAAGGQNASISGGQYQFTIQSIPLSDAIFFSAGANQSNATPVPGPCFGGILNHGHADAWYAFNATAPGTIDLSVIDDGTHPVAVSVLSSADATIATLAPDSAMTVTLPSAGVYFLHASTTSTDVSPFLIGSGPPPGPACRPACALGG
ncbi:MAG: hypothetical protein ACYDDF_06380 [Thermoplasmatota archaeon]